MDKVDTTVLEYTKMVFKAVEPIQPGQRHNQGSISLCSRVTSVGLFRSVSRSIWLEWIEEPAFLKHHLTTTPKTNYKPPITNKL